MKKKMLLVVILTVLCLSSLIGCGEDNSTKNKDSKSEKESKEKITIDELEYDVKAEISDDERCVMMTLTNNSKYTLAGFEVQYKLKSDVTDEQKNKIYDEVIKDFELSDDDAKKFRKTEISMFVITKKTVEPKEIINNIRLYYNGGYYNLKNMEHFEMVEPDIITVKYIDEGKIYTMYYDCLNKSYSYDTETEPADEWSMREWGKMLPKPDAKYITSSQDDEEKFIFDAYGVNIEYFNEYVEQCKELGYTENKSSHEGYYTADSKDGYNVYLHYYDRDAVISGTIEKSEGNND